MKYRKHFVLYMFFPIAKRCKFDQTTSYCICYWWMSGKFLGVSDIMSVCAIYSCSS